MLSAQQRTPPYVRVDNLIEMFLRHFPELSNLVQSRIHKQDVDAAGLLLDDFVDLINVAEVLRYPPGRRLHSRRLYLLRSPVLADDGRL